MQPVLPLKMQGNIAVIGPLADTRTNMPGTWSVAAILDKSPSLIEGLKEMTAGKATILIRFHGNLTSDAAYEERATLFGAAFIGMPVPGCPTVARSIDGSSESRRHSSCFGRIFRNER